MSLDLSPLFRSTVGFDRMSRLFEDAFTDVAPAYPPYNIEKHGDNEYRIVMAVAGFGAGDLKIVAKENTLVVEGKQNEKQNGTRYLHRGIAARAFERRFELADHINVVGSRLENGLLVIELKREIPEALKPRTIAIQTGAPAVEHRVAA
ncbi:MAG: Hsp20 family protein [Rhodospirillaceae bacterium]|nr:Hsp20 family protein [Rhodospirillaceae bacterium]